MEELDIPARDELDVPARNETSDPARNNTPDPARVEASLISMENVAIQGEESNQTVSMQGEETTMDGPEDVRRYSPDPDSMELGGTPCQGSPINMEVARAPVIYAFQDLHPAVLQWRYVHV